MQPERSKTTVRVAPPRTHGRREQEKKDKCARVEASSSVASRRTRREGREINTHHVVNILRRKVLLSERLDLLAREDRGAGKGAGEGRGEEEERRAHGSRNKELFGTLPGVTAWLLV